VACCAALCCVTLCHAVLCRAMLCCRSLRSVLQRYGVVCQLQAYANSRTLVSVVDTAGLEEQMDGELRCPMCGR